MPTLLKDGTIIRDVSKTDESIYSLVTVPKIGPPVEGAVAVESERVFPPGCEPAPIVEITSEEDVVKTILTFVFEETDADNMHAPPDDPGGFTILCAEDNRVNQRLLGKSLNRFDIDAVIVENGEEAVKMYKSDPWRFRCILMDIAMPVMSGIEATRRIRTFESARGDLRAAFVVGLVASATPGGSLSLAAHGFDALLAKPISLSKMADVLFGDEASNIVTAYGRLTARERRRFPLRPTEHRRRAAGVGMYGTCARGRAIAEELVRMRQRGDFDALRFMVDVKVKVVRRGEMEGGKGEGGKGG